MRPAPGSQRRADTYFDPRFRPFNSVPAQARAVSFWRRGSSRPANSGSAAWTSEFLMRHTLGYSVIGVYMLFLVGAVLLPWAGA